MNAPIRRALTLCAVTMAMMLMMGGFAGPAGAHVTVQPGTATAGGYGGFSFRVPTERDNASTNKLEVTFPAEQPLASVTVKPHPGWNYKVEKMRLTTPIKRESGDVTEAVSKITWTPKSKANVIKPGEFDEFMVSGGPLPKAEQMVFKAIQYYDNGEIVRWIEESAPGSERPKHPAPVLKLVPPAQPAGAAGSGDDDSTATTAIVLAVIALLVGLASGLLTGLTLRRGGIPPKRAASPSPTESTP